MRSFCRHRSAVCLRSRGPERSCHVRGVRWRRNTFLSNCLRCSCSLFFLFLTISPARVNAKGSACTRCRGIYLRFSPSPRVSSHWTMAILRSCCCWKSVRSGSFACAIYTLVLYAVILTASAFHVNTVLQHTVLLTFSSLVLAFAGCCVISSALLLAGLCVDNKFLLLPWIVSIVLETILDIIVSLYLFTEAKIDPFIGVFYMMDFLIIALNVYCLLCVTSQFQEYSAGRGRAIHITDQLTPAIHLEPPSGRQWHGQSPKLAISVIQNGQSSSLCQLLVPSSSGTGRSTVTTDASSISQRRRDSTTRHLEDTSIESEFLVINVAGDDTTSPTRELRADVSARLQETVHFPGYRRPSLPVFPRGTHRFFATCRQEVERRPSISGSSPDSDFTSEPDRDQDLPVVMSGSESFHHGYRHPSTP